ncbi:MAG: hypothetical protein ACPG5B_02170 [Chitinophagales bacterium]
MSNILVKGLIDAELVSIKKQYERVITELEPDKMEIAKLRASYHVLERLHAQAEKALEIIQATKKE